MTKWHMHEYLSVTSLKSLMYIICELLSSLVKDHWMLHSIYQSLFLFYTDFGMESIEP